MQNKILIYILYFLLFQINSNAQNRKLEKANKAFDNFSFVKAAKYYQEVLDQGYSSKQVYKNLGDSYYYNAKYDMAGGCYSHLFEHYTANLQSEYYFRYAQTLNHLGEYQKAVLLMKRYYKLTGKTDSSDNWSLEGLLAKNQKQSGGYSVRELEVNSQYSDFGAAFYGNEKVIYASAKDTGLFIKRKDQWNEQSFLKLYQADISLKGEFRNPQLLKGEVNTKLHQCSPVITKDGKTMYFTRSNFTERKQKAGKKGITFLKIYSAQNTNGNWTNIKELGFPINSDGFSSAHPALSPDEKKLYFVSDRGNDFGNSDLYVVSHKEDGFIGNDVARLSDDINTHGRETYPYMDENGVLYFSSDGHPGYGGLDLYAAIEDENQKYHVVNLGSGINSERDDFALIINKDRKGYFSSDRKGNDNIYGFSENKALDFGFNIYPLVYGTLKNEKTGDPVRNASIEVYDQDNKKTAVLYSDREGKYTVMLKPFKNYKICYSGEALTGREEKITSLKPLEKREISLDFLLYTEILTEKGRETIRLGDDLTGKLKLGNVYFDYNGNKIRKSSRIVLDKIVEFLKERPDISIKINSYTDSRGNDDFNMKLSANRARATLEYLIQNGIDPARLSCEGFGETYLLNNCDNGENCSEAEHRINRRSEFIVVGTKPPR